MFDIYKYKDYITSEDDEKILLHCILPGHNDANRSAVYYKATGQFFCPTCGSIKTTGQSGLVSEHKKKRIHNRLFFDTTTYKQHYVELSDGSIEAANWSKEENKVIGITTRTPEGQYRLEGEPGFRLFAPILTESLTDAICLLKYGIDAGSINSIVNKRLVRSNHIYFPQLDAPGIKCALEIQRMVKCPIYWWDHQEQGKDIRDVSEELRSKILNELSENFLIKV